MLEKVVKLGDVVFENEKAKIRLRTKMLASVTYRTSAEFDTPKLSPGLIQNQDVWPPVNGYFNYTLHITFQDYIKISHNSENCLCSTIALIIEEAPLWSQLRLMATYLEPECQDCQSVKCFRIQLNIGRLQDPSRDERTQNLDFERNCDMAISYSPSWSHPIHLSSVDLFLNFSSSLPFSASYPSPIQDLGEQDDFLESARSHHTFSQDPRNDLEEGKKSMLHAFDINASCTATNTIDMVLRSSFDPQQVVSKRGIQVASHNFTRSLCSFAPAVFLPGFIEGITGRAHLITGISKSLIPFSKRKSIAGSKLHGDSSDTSFWSTNQVSSMSMEDDENRFGKKLQSDLWETLRNYLTNACTIPRLKPLGRIKYSKDTQIQTRNVQSQIEKILLTFPASEIAGELNNLLTDNSNDQEQTYQDFVDLHDVSLQSSQGSSNAEDAFAAMLFCEKSTCNVKDSVHSNNITSTKTIVAPCDKNEQLPSFEDTDTLASPPQHMFDYENSLISEPQNDFLSIIPKFNPSNESYEEDTSGTGVIDLIGGGTRLTHYPTRTVPPDDFHDIIEHSHIGYTTCHGINFHDVRPISAELSLTTYNIDFEPDFLSDLEVIQFRLSDSIHTNEFEDLFGYCTDNSKSEEHLLLEQPRKDLFTDCGGQISPKTLLENRSLSDSMWKRRSKALAESHDMMVEMQNFQNTDINMDLDKKSCNTGNGAQISLSDPQRIRINDNSRMSPEVEALARRSFFLKRSGSSSSSLPSSPPQTPTGRPRREGSGLLKSFSRGSQISTDDEILNLDFNDLSRPMEVKRRKTLKDYEMSNQSSPDKKGGEHDTDDMLFG